MNRCYGTLAPVALSNDYAVVPCNGKKPYPTGWPNADKEQIEQWAVDFPDANVGLVCGEIIFIDLDIDAPILLRIAQQQVAEILGPSSHLVGRTNTCRIKIAYRTDDEVHKRRIAVEGGHTEILAKGQQGIVAGKLPCGSEYFGGEDILATPKEELPLVSTVMLDKLKKFFAELEISPVGTTQDDFNPAEASFPRQGEEQGVERPVNPANYARQVLCAKLDDVRAAHEGERNNELFKAAVRIQQVVETGEGDVPKDWRQQLTQAAMDTGLFHSDIEATIKSGIERGSRDGPLWEPAAEGPQITPIMSGTISQSARAKLLQQAIGAEVRCAEGSWFCWDGKLWKRDKTGRIKWLTTEFHGAHGSSKSNIDALVALLSYDPRVAVLEADFDKDPMLLGTPEGVLELRNGAVLDNAKGLLISKTTAVSAQPSDTPLWNRFIWDVTGGDDDLAHYLQKIAGYCLTGSVKEHALFFVFGEGGNGKSVFLETIKGVMGDYAITTGLDLLEELKYRGIPVDIARLKGVRLATASETGDRPWDEQRVKMLTGGDSLQARRMRQDPWEFRPTHKLLVVGNSMPFMREVGAAEARRLRFVPFIHKPPRPNLDLLGQLKGEWPGVLYWALEGCFSWQKEGMDPPKIVEEATSSYVAAMDHFGGFFKDCLVDARTTGAGAEQFVPTADVRGLYIAWCMRDEVEERSTEWLGKQMRKRGFVADRRSCKPGGKAHGQHRVWLGVAVAKEAKLRAA